MCRGLFEPGVFGNGISLALKSLFHLFGFFEYFLTTRTALLQIFVAETFDLRCSGVWINFNLVTESLQLLG